jgi:hypothetical protein
MTSIPYARFPSGQVNKITCLVKLARQVILPVRPVRGNLAQGSPCHKIQSCYYLHVLTLPDKQPVDVAGKAEGKHDVKDWRHDGERLVQVAVLYR